jgi:hypothetical protein
LALNPGSAAVYGQSALLAGGSSANVTRGGKAGVFFDWVAAGGNPYAQYSELADAYYEQFLADDAWLGGLKESERKKYAFTYREPDQYDTAADFEIYESHWAYLMRMGGLPGSLDPWAEEALRETYPWPGKDAYESASVFYQLDSEVNISDTASGLPKTYDERTDEGGPFTEKEFSEYGG